MKRSDKNDRGTQPDPVIVEEIRRRTIKGDLPCAVAFNIAATIGIDPSRVGHTADLMNVSLSKCQLGLFGYTPNKKIVAPRTPEKAAVTDAIRRGLVNDRLPCATAWNIAADCGISKLAVANACEALNVKIKPCQLGAF
jgi:hypothetical protein